MKKYLIKKVLNNNVISVEHRGINYILSGKGIGYDKKKGDWFEDTSAVELRFISLEGIKQIEQDHLLNRLDPEIVESVQKVLEIINVETGNQFDIRNHAGLLDHIQFLIKRLKEGFEIRQPFMHETQILYPKEYAIAEKCVECVRNELGLEIPDDEIGFLTFHIHSGIQSKKEMTPLKEVKLINKITQHVEKKLDTHFDPKSFDYNRFIIHIKGVLQRLSSGKTLENNLLTEIQNKYIIEYKVAYDVAKIIEGQCGFPVPEGEIGYIAIHLVKLNHLV